MSTSHAAGELPAADERSAAVLADRIAVLVLDRTPGWRLPRPSLLARRYNASIADVNNAIRELIDRQLVRRLADGRLCRSGPADYLITLAGVDGLGLSARVDPMGAPIACASAHVAWRPVPEEVGLVLDLPPGSETTVVRCLWDAGKERAAVTTTYLRGHLQAADHHDDGHQHWDAELDSLPVQALAPLARPAAAPAALQVEIQPPAASVARSLHLAPGTPAVAVAIRFDSHGGSPIALTLAYLRAEMFRVIVEAPSSPPPAAGQLRSLLRGSPEPDP